jgi:hypothetical protein
MDISTTPYARSIPDMPIILAMVNLEVVFIYNKYYYCAKKEADCLCPLDNDVVRRTKKHGRKEKERGIYETGE